MKNKNRYAAIIEHIFSSKFQPGTREVDFLREELVTVARKLRIKLPKNLGDLVYSFRYRADLPESIRKHAGKSAWKLKRSISVSKNCLIRFWTN